MRGSALFRREYYPGSVLYVAWTHARENSQLDAEFNFGRNMDGLFATRPDNIRVVKASWWLVR